MTDSTPRPEPTVILSKAAALENLMTWMIAASLCKDARAFDLFMGFAADRIPVDVKIKLLDKIIEGLPGVPDPYSGFLDDLRNIVQVRNRVAHSIYIPSPVGMARVGHVMFRKGLPDSVSDEELRRQVSDALSRITRVQAVLEALGTTLGFQSGGGGDPGAGLQG